MVRNSHNFVDCTITKAKDDITTSIHLLRKYHGFAELQRYLSSSSDHMTIKGGHWKARVDRNGPAHVRDTGVLVLRTLLILRTRCVRQYCMIISGRSRDGVIQLTQWHGWA